MNPRKYSFDNEDNIFEIFRGGHEKLVPFTDGDEESRSLKRIREIFLSLYLELEWVKWKNNSANTNFPPDYYSKELRMMMEVMRIDDNATKKGKLNKRLSSENKALNELWRSNILDSFPNLKTVVINANNELKTSEDHSYLRYLENFKRVVEKHSTNIETYKKNYKNHDLIFFVFDETSGIYFESQDLKCDLNVGLDVSGKPHLHMYNVEFLEIIRESGADYFVWFKPFSYIPSSMPKELSFLSGATIFDINCMDETVEKYGIKYNASQMMSIET